MLLPLAYPAATDAFAFLRLLTMSDQDKDIEILALRYQLLILQRQVGMAAFTDTDRTIIAGLLHHLPKRKLRRLLLRCHRRCATASTRFRCGGPSRCAPPGPFHDRRNGGPDCSTGRHVSAYESTCPTGAAARAQVPENAQRLVQGAGARAVDPAIAFNDYRCPSRAEAVIS